MYVIAIVGAGGKTSRIKNLTREYVQQGKSVLVTTTTHMGLEPDMGLFENLEDIRQQLEKQNVCICGSPVKEEKILTTSQALNLLKLRGYVIKDDPLPTS